jgi:general secretion pathway protein D
VVRDAKASDALSTNRYEQMMGLQRNAVPSFNPLLDTGPTPTLPPLTPTSQPAAMAPATPPTTPATR